MVFHIVKSYRHISCYPAVFCDKSSTYNTLLSMAGLCSLGNRRLQDIGILMYKVMHNLCPNYISSFFKFPNSSYILRNNDFIIQGSY